MRHFGLSYPEAERLHKHPMLIEILGLVEVFRESNGFPPKNSSLVRSELARLVPRISGCARPQEED
jgi:hypothetical protein